ncbi:MAG: bifunctional AP-4-A phosphorylase/ADP sulfurylase [Sclerophora amabilis]|nr:MAG: bifunctional AP-4-A phosphorylase/ADP sulfurylase [Sclerophora amabilis]
MLLDLTEHLPALVKRKYNAAKANGSLTFSHTELTVLHAGGTAYQLRYCPALSKKPEPQKKTRPSSSPTKEKFNPFEDPTADLLVAELPRDKPRHRLVLNKYPVIPQHFILATKVFKRQTDLLEEDDLATAYACLSAWESGQETGNSGKLFAFFNSGEHSGASQPHRHLQFLPVDEVVGEDGGQGWTLLADELTPSSDSRASSQDHRDLPFIYFRRLLPPAPTSNDLVQTYQWLYDRAVSSVRSLNHTAVDESPDAEASSGGGAAEISYNLAMTTTSMVLCPRRRGGAALDLGSAHGLDQKDIGPIDVNGTVLGGTLMVKTEEEWDALRGDESRLLSILRVIGYPPGSEDPSLNEKL